MPEGEKFPLLTWSNGTCAMPEGYGPLLRMVASYGYIVVAANSVQTGSGNPYPGIKALDFMFAANDDPSSKYYQHIDTDKVGAFGHSQGSSATVTVANDARVKAVILFNGGTNAAKDFLAISGDHDISGSAASYSNAINAAQVKAAWVFFHQIPANVGDNPPSTTGATAPGHLTLMMEPERVEDLTIAWFDMMLKGKDDAKQMFLGDSCTLCSGTAYGSMWASGGLASGSVMTPTLEYGHNAKLQ